jgi:hypothetical protein
MKFLLKSIVAALLNLCQTEIARSCPSAIEREIEGASDEAMVHISRRSDLHSLFSSFRLDHETIVKFL